VNPVFAVLLVECVCLSWLRGVHLQKFTGDMPAPRRKAIRRRVGWTIAWEEATPRGRALLILGLIWPVYSWLGWLLLLASPRTSYLMATRQDSWLIAAALPLIILGVQAFLLWGFVASARRR
jgi:hypothetical protein